MCTVTVWVDNDQQKDSTGLLSLVTIESLFKNASQQGSIATH